MILPDRRLPVNIVLLGHRDLASVYALNRLIRLLPAHHYSVFWSQAPANSKAVPAALANLAATDERLCERFNNSHGVADVLLSAETLGAPNSAGGLTVLRNSTPDLIVSIRYRQILRDEAIAIPRHGVLNLHSGILPDYRGVMATFWAMLNDEKEIGSTTHRIVDAGIDTGPVIGITRRPVRRDLSYLANVLGIYYDGCQMLTDAMQSIDRNELLVEQARPKSKGKYYSTPDEIAVANFLGKQLRFADGHELDEI